MLYSKLHLSLKFKLLASTISITLIVSGLATFIIRDRSIDERTNKLEGFVDEADSLAQAIAVQFYERYGDVQAFALNPVLQDQSPKNQANIESYLNQYVKLYGIYDTILYVDLQGKYVASNGIGLDGSVLHLDSLRSTSFHDTIWFKNSVRGVFTEDKNKGFNGTFVEDPDVDRISTMAYGSNKYGNGFSSPVKNMSGEVIGVITNRANFSWVEKEFEVAKKNFKRDEYGDVQMNLINGANQLIVNFDQGDVVKRDFSVLAKEDISNKKEGAGAKFAKSSGTNYGIYDDQEGGGKLASAIKLISNEKWVDSLGWSVLLTNKYDQIFAKDIMMERNLLIIQGGATFFFAIAGWLFSSRMSKNFMLVAERLGKTAELSHMTSVQLTTASQAVSNSSTDQSAAVQETVSSMSEISSMITQTNSNVKECTQIASRVTGRSEQGNQTMRRLASAMDAVNHANSQLQNMANIINEVSAKTMVINDIVFKTQLLSINASIEAARAGQHGKGFAVVAEEVGNLAQMSGNAAKEIQLLISDSQKQVHQIIEVTQARSKESQSVSQEALQAFSEIASGIVAINERLAGVTQATHEQEIGIQQISIAMTQMDQSTQRNSTLAAEANELAVDLGKQSELSYRIVRALRTLVVGSTALKPKKSTDIVDSLMYEDNEKRDAEPQRLAGPAQGKGSNLVDLASRFEDRMGSVKQSAPMESIELSADDESFKKPA